MFDASVIANVLYIFDGFHTPPFAIIASHTVSRRVSDRSVALAASCSSVDLKEHLAAEKQIAVARVDEVTMAAIHADPRS